MFLGRQINHPGPRPKTVCPIRSCGEAAFQRWSCSLVSFGEKNRFALSLCGQAAGYVPIGPLALESGEEFVAGSSTVCSRSNSGYCPWGSPIMTLPAISTLPLRALCGYVKTAALETVVENHRLSFSLRSGGCKRIAHFASTFCKELRRIGARLEILSRCGQRLLPQHYYP